MTIGLLGRKVGMTRVYDDAGMMIPVTVLEAGPCPIIQIKNPETDGYAALQIGYDTLPERKVNRPMGGHFKRAGVSPTRIVREFRTDELDGYEVGGSLDSSLFEAGEKIDISGISKGRGFAGAQKRHNTGRGPTSHGSHYHRQAGSLGASATPSRVMKGKKQAGRMGNERVSVQNLKIVKVDPERNLILVRGSVPGANDGYVEIRKSVKAARKAAAR